MMKQFLSGFLFLMILPFWGLAQQSESVMKDVYKALSSDDAASIQLQIDNLKNTHTNISYAYEGALLMRKAGISRLSPKQKLALFKSGRSKLETVISKEPSNVEFRFLRYIIQENAPWIVNYHSNKDEDAEMIRSHFHSLSALLQHEITEYSKKSKGLKLP